MTWKLTEWGKTREGLAGVPWREMTDEEFAAAELKFDDGALRQSGLFEFDADGEGEHAVAGCRCRFKDDPYVAPSEHAASCPVHKAFVKAAEADASEEE